MPLSKRKDPWKLFFKFWLPQTGMRVVKASALPPTWALMGNRFEVVEGVMSDDFKIFNWY
jgi:hypothetical protein